MCWGPVGRDAASVTEEDEPFTKIAIFLAQSASENASANTRLLGKPETRWMLLISSSDPGLPRPAWAKEQVILRGSPKGRTHPVPPAKRARMYY